jgi:hypothetical protein
MPLVPPPFAVVLSYWSNRCRSCAIRTPAARTDPSSRRSNPESRIRPLSKRIAHGCAQIGRFQLVATTFVVSDGRCGCLEGQCRVLPQEEPRTHYIACVNIVSNAKRTAAVRRGPQPRSPTPYTKTLNRDRTAASAPAGSPGDPCVCTSFSTRATARARVPSLPPSSHAARFCRSATWG